MKAAHTSVASTRAGLTTNPLLRNESMADADSMALTQERLQQVLHYDPETGAFTWVRPGSSRVSPGSVAGAVAHGYVKIGVFKRDYGAHRLAWLYMTGEFPARGIEVDHRNGIRSDNRWSNLRLATRQQNSRNSIKKGNNTSGHKGVTWDKSRDQWIVGIKVDYKRRNLGRFDRLEDAIACYQRASHELFGEFDVHKRGSNEREL